MALLLEVGQPDGPNPHRPLASPATIDLDPLFFEREERRHASLTISLRGCLERSFGHTSWEPLSLHLRDLPPGTAVKNGDPPIKKLFQRVQVLPYSESADNRIESAAFMIETASNAPTVLVIDEEPLIRQLVGSFLRSRHLTPIEACSGTEALHIIRTQKVRPDLVIVDLIMPELGGLGLLQKLREEKEDIAALIVSGCCPDPEALTAAIDERTHFLAKPFNFKMLEVEINNLLSPAAAKATSSLD